MKYIYSMLFGIFAFGVLADEVTKGFTLPELNQTNRHDGEFKNLPWHTKQQYVQNELVNGDRYFCAVTVEDTGLGGKLDYASFPAYITVSDKLQLRWGIFEGPELTLRYVNSYTKYSHLFMAEEKQEIFEIRPARSHNFLEFEYWPIEKPDKKLPAICELIQ